MDNFKIPNLNFSISKTRKYNFAILLFLLINALSCAVCNEDVETSYKRHSGKNSHEQNAPFCRSVCSKVNSDCSANCYPPRGTAHTVFATTFPSRGTTYNVRKSVAEKYSCIDQCLKQNDSPYVIPNECSVIAEPEDDDDDEDDDETTRRPAPTKKQSFQSKSRQPKELDMSKMTTAERCKLQAFKNSTVCKFEQESPDTARRLFESNRPKLTLCTGGTVMSGDRGLYTNRAVKSFIAQQDLLASGRTSRSNQEEDIGPIVLRRMKRTKRSLKARKKRQSVVRRQNRPVCPTETNIESPSRAIHRGTGKIVDIYFYEKYSQWFELGSCKQAEPVGISGDGVRCAMAETAHKAYIMIQPSTFTKSERDKFMSCGTIPHLESKYQVCWDWVYLPSHCKLFL